MVSLIAVKIATFAGTALALSAIVYLMGGGGLKDLPNRIPEAAPYVTAEAITFPPPYEQSWQGQDHPGQCQACHQKIFDEWNGSMMSNSWRDPVWRAAFLLLARATSAYGECDTPNPPDGTPKASHNPFATGGGCASKFDTGARTYTLSRPGSLLDGFCSRCHMPANYLDNVKLLNVKTDAATHRENAPLDINFNPTADNGTGLAFAEVDSQYRNTDSGRIGVFCAVCHTYAATRDTPFHNYERAGNEYYPATKPASRSEGVDKPHQDLFQVADPGKRNLGYGIGAGSFRLSPHAITIFEPFGPLAANQPPVPIDSNTSQVFGEAIPYQHIDTEKHKGFHQAMFVRAEMCAACHDVTNALPIRNSLHKWVGGFPIERTYTEWANSRYADRPGNRNYDPHFKRDCQSCHMQQDYGQPGTAQTLYKEGQPLPIPVEAVANGGAGHPFFTHHFVGGNALVPRMIGKDVDRSGNVSPYPELSVFSFSSADPRSPYSRALWTHSERRGAYAQQARLAWDRLRHVLSMDLKAPARANAGTSVPVEIVIANTGSGHNFPTGFPEGRTAWLAIHAYDLATGRQLQIHDSVWNRTSLGVGDLTTEDMIDPNFPGCNWKIPAGSADPYAMPFKAVASLGDGCPTLELPYATPLNLVTNKDGLPVDRDGRVIDAATNPDGLPQFRDLNGNGDLFDDSFLRDTRFKPMPLAEATKRFDRYSIVIPPGVRGPIAVSAAVYYQSVEAIVALKFLGNLADTNRNFVLEPCVLGGLCDGRTPGTEPAVVEGSPPVPMIVRNSLIVIDAALADHSPIRVVTYPADGAVAVYEDAVVKVSFNRPVRGVDSSNFTLTDSRGTPVPSRVDQIGDATWGLFPNAALLKPGERYTARLKRGICGGAANCTDKDVVWSFRVCPEGASGTGDTSVPTGYSIAQMEPGIHTYGRDGATNHK
ncbi:MAG TPA: Ig-like domain-containing protein [Bryobacteraceae bacterium]|nr:Ig-like domain-containing protein [Bryobacteraceae bacterium]